MKYFSTLPTKKQLEEKDALEAIKVGEDEFKLGKLKSTTNFSEFTDRQATIYKLVKSADN